MTPTLKTVSHNALAIPHSDIDRQSWTLGPFTKEDAVNPILGPDKTQQFECPMTKTANAWEHDHVFNPAAVVRDGKVYLFYRAEDNSGVGIGQHTSRIGLAESTDGLHFTKHPVPVLFPDEDDQREYEWTGGCEDPRIVETDFGSYLMLYTQFNGRVPRLSAAMSEDLIHWKKYGPVFKKFQGGRFLDIACKSGAVVTELVDGRLIAKQIDGKYWMYYGEGTVYAASSTNLIDWSPILNEDGDLLPLLEPRPGRFDSSLAEGGPPAVVTSNGIVVLYNGKNAEELGDPSLSAGTYSGGQALFHREDPTKLLDLTDGWFITPERPYEITGQYTDGTVFIEGLVHFKNRWFLYYGTADTYVAVASAPLCLANE